MDNKNTINIRCNPYTQKIDYYRWSCEECEWNKITSSSSPFSKPKFTHTVLQNVDYEIVKEMDEMYNTGNIGLDIYFDGTKEDKEELENIIETYFSKCNIQIKTGETFLLSAVEVKRTIEDIFSDMNRIFKEYPDNDVTRTISKFSEAVHPTIPICVMGLYSAGKSAFINSILGIELLPSASDPTTAKTFKISSGNKYEIKFKFGNDKKEEVVLSFDGEQYKSSQSGEMDIIKELEAINQDDTLEKKLYHALTIISNYDMNRNKNIPNEEKVFAVSDLIEITLPIYSSVLPFRDYDFVIYDTPGSNSASNTDHTEVLKKAMEGQTNGLPIFVTTPDNMDGEDNNALIDTIDKLGGALDKSNLMIIVNKADEKDSGTLENKKKNFSNLSISNLNPAGVYFVSSIFGLGNKKMLSRNTKVNKKGQTIPDWIDKTYEKVYNSNVNCFEDDEDDYYLQLYLHNIVPQKYYDSYCSINLGESMLGYQNSGLHCVEYAIAEFADKYALYNKCRNASGYLSDALVQLNAILRDLSKEQEELSGKLQTNLNEQEQAVLEKLKKACDKMKSDFMNQYANKCTFLHKNKINKLESIITSKIKTIWSESKDKLERRKYTTSEINNLLEEYVEEYLNEAEDVSHEFWESKDKEFKDNLISIIVQSSFLSSEQQKLLKDAILNLNGIPKYMLNAHIQKNDVAGRFLFLRYLKSDVTNTFIDSYKSEITTINNQLSNQSLESFDDLIKNVDMKFKSLVTKYNPKVVGLSKQLEECSSRINLLIEHKKEVEMNKTKVQDLITFHSVVNNT